MDIRAFFREHYIIISIILLITLTALVNYQSIRGIITSESFKHRSPLNEMTEMNQENFTQENAELKESSVKPYFLCLMAIFKNEHTYMEEWLDHHIKQGISHFYLYSNDPRMHNYKYLNDKYADYVTVIPWVNKQNNGAETVQRQAYTHCIQTFNNQYQFLMMLDIDEFLCPTKINNGNTVISIIKDAISNSNLPINSIKVPRYNYGSDGHVHRPSGNVMDNYFTHEPICSSYKTIANAQYIDTNKKFYGVHDFPMKKGGKIINPQFTYAETGFPNGCKADMINQISLEIKHYYTKSYDEYLERCKLWTKGGVNTVGYRQNCQETFNEKAFFN